MTCQTIGLPPISTSGFGIAWVCSCRRVPRPPQRIATGISARERASGATGHGGQDGHLVAVVEGSVQTVLKADVLAGDVDVDEAAQGAVLGNPLTETGVLLEDCVERLADGRSLDLELPLAPGGRPELGWNLDG